MALKSFQSSKKHLVITKKHCYHAIYSLFLAVANLPVPRYLLFPAYSTGYPVFDRFFIAL